MPVTLAEPAHVATKRLLVVDDHPILRRGLTALIEAEPDFVAAAKEADPDMSKEKLKELIMRFRAAVYEKQQRDRQSG